MFQPAPPFSLSVDTDFVPVQIGEPAGGAGGGGDGGDGQSGGGGPQGGGAAGQTWQAQPRPRSGEGLAPGPRRA